MQHSQPMKEWFTADELGGIDGLPLHRSSFSKKATKGHWLKRQCAGGKGSAFEYHITSLPDVSQQALRKMALTRGESSALSMLWTMPDNTMSPTLKAGEQVVINHCSKANVNGLYLVMHNEQLTLRRVQWIESQRKYAVLCDNLNCPARYSRHVTILAKVIGVITPTVQSAE